MAATEAAGAAWGRRERKGDGLGKKSADGRRTRAASRRQAGSAHHGVLQQPARELHLLSPNIAPSTIEQGVGEDSPDPDPAQEEQFHHGGVLGLIAFFIFDLGVSLQNSRV